VTMISPEPTVSEKLDILATKIEELQNQVAAIQLVIDQAQEAIQAASQNPMAKMMLKNFGLV